jgi:ribosome modulation factor
VTNRRRRIVERIRAEGRAAARNGKHEQTNPYKTYDMDRMQWSRGYHEGLLEKLPQELRDCMEDFST